MGGRGGQFFGGGGTGERNTPPPPKERKKKSTKWGSLFSSFNWGLRGSFAVHHIFLVVQVGKSVDMHKYHHICLLIIDTYNQFPYFLILKALT